MRSIMKKYNEICSELEEKNKTIRKIKLENNEQNEKMKNLQLALDLERSQNERQDTRYSKVIAKKEKKIDDLHTLIYKSYNSARISLDKVKLASRLEIGRAHV